MQEDAPFIVLRGSKERDPDGRKLSAAIRAHYAYERMRDIREILVYLLSALSVGLWLLVQWPHVAGFFRRLILLGWPATFAGLLATGAQEAWRFHERARLMNELRGSSGGGP